MASTGSLGPEDPHVETIKRSPAFWAKLGHHPYWPARVASKEEQKKFSSYQRKSNQVCVKFYGSNDIGWIFPSSLVLYEEGLRRNFNSNSKVTKNAKFLAGVDEAAKIWEEYNDFQGGRGGHGYSGSPSYMVYSYGEEETYSYANGDGNGTTSWIRSGPESCLTCALPRGGDAGFMICKACGSGYHPRCVGTTPTTTSDGSVQEGGGGGGEEESAEGEGGGAAGSGGGSEGGKNACCRICVDGGSLALAPPPETASFRALWSPPAVGAAAIANGDGGKVVSGEEGGEGGGGGAAPAVGEQKKARGRPRNAENGGDGGEGGKKRRTSGNAAGGGGAASAAASTGLLERKVRWGQEGTGDWDGWGTACSWDDQEYECFVCKESGMLIQCDAPNCRRAYHKPCLGLSAWGQQFFCPRHRCAVCRQSEADLAKASTAAPASSSSSAHVAATNGHNATATENGGATKGGEGASLPHEGAAAAAAAGGVGDKKMGSSGKRIKLWRCSSCPVAYCPNHLPAGYENGQACSHPHQHQQQKHHQGHGGHSSKTTRTGGGAGQGGEENRRPVCHHCSTPSPRIRLARILERSWARLATNYLALPFMRPFLNGVSGPPPAEGEGGADKPELLDFVTIALRIRSLQYRSADHYLADLETLVKQATRMTRGYSDLAILEGLETLVGNAKRFLDAVRKEVTPAEATIVEEEYKRGVEGLNGSEMEIDEPLAGVKWRCELEMTQTEAIPPEYCPAKTLEEWTEYVAKAPMLHIETQQPFSEGDDTEVQDIEKGEIARVIAQLRFEDSFPHKTTLLHCDHLEAALEKQATLLRRCLEGHAMLRRSIKEEKTVVMQFPRDKATQHNRKRSAATTSASEAEAEKKKKKKKGGGEGGEDENSAAAEDVIDVGGEEEGDDEDDSNIVTLGDMHILKELQIANQNLRARLDNKNSLLRQRETQLRAAKKAFLDLQEQNAKLKEKVHSLEMNSSS